MEVMHVVFIMWGVYIVYALCVALYKHDRLMRVARSKTTPSKKQTPLEALTEISERRQKAVDTLHDSWDTWWTSVAGGEAPERKSKPKPKRNADRSGPFDVYSTGRQSYSREDIARVYRWAREMGDVELMRQCGIVYKAMPPGSIFTPKEINGVLGRGLSYGVDGNNLSVKIKDAYHAYDNEVD
jgi:hypothetical protein